MSKPMRSASAGALDRGKPFAHSMPTLVHMHSTTNVDPKKALHDAEQLHVHLGVTDLCQGAKQQGIFGIVLTCCRCGGPCGPHPTLRTRKGLEIRGLRLCQQEECNLVQNRDKTGSINIGKQFCRLMKKQPTQHQLTATELELQALSSCVECSIDS
jgi:hypothetical protein